MNGIGGVDLRTYKRVTVADLRRANPSLAAHWWDDTRGMEVDGRLRLASRDGQEVLEVDPATLRAAPVAAPQRSNKPPFAPTPADYLGAGLHTAPAEWLGLHSPAEVEREFKPNSWLRRVVRAEDAKELRRFYRGVLDPDAGGARSRIVSMTPLGDDAYLNAAFLRLDDDSEPLRLSNPDGALMAYTSAPGLKGTLVVARVDTAGKVLWKADTGIDRFKLAQILPGDASMAFVGTRPAVPDKVPEPLLVIVDNRTGNVTRKHLVAIEAARPATGVHGGVGVAGSQASILRIRPRQVVPPTLIPNAATRGRGGRDGGREQGRGERSGAVSAAPSEAQRALSLRPGLPRDQARPIPRPSRRRVVGAGTCGARVSPLAAAALTGRRFPGRQIPAA